MVDPAAVGQRILARRQALKLSRAKLAGLAKISYQSVWRYERGQLPDGDELLRLASSLGVTAQELLTGEPFASLQKSSKDYKRPDHVDRVAALMVNELDPLYGKIPEDVWRDQRFVSGIEQLAQVLLAPNKEEAAALLKNIEVFAREARRHLGVRRRKAG